jgi:hypothetical protein
MLYFQLTSYGGNLRYKVYYDISGSIESPTTQSDVIITVSITQSIWLSIDVGITLSIYQLKYILLAVGISLSSTFKY